MVGVFTPQILANITNGGVSPQETTPVVKHLPVHHNFILLTSEKTSEMVITPL